MKYLRLDDGTIQALIDIYDPDDIGNGGVPKPGRIPLVRKDTLGGKIASYKNLSQSGSCWVEDGMYDTGGNCLSDPAEVIGDAQVSGDAVIKSGSTISGSARIYGQAVIENAIVTDSARVCDNARVYSDRTNAAYETQIRNDKTRRPTVRGKARVYGNAVIKDIDTKIMGNARVLEDAVIYRRVDLSAAIPTGAEIGGVSPEHSEDNGGAGNTSAK
jgi:carbonic anhydrase/acetyltransferase-like protein (isoleucine patch superfamily)